VSFSVFFVIFVAVTAACKGELLAKVVSEHNFDHAVHRIFDMALAPQYVVVAFVELTNVIEWHEDLFQVCSARFFGL